MNLVHLQAALFMKTDVIIQVDNRIEFREARQAMYSLLGTPHAAMLNRYKYDDYWIEFVNLEENPGFESDKLIFYVGETYPNHYDSQTVGRNIEFLLNCMNEFKDQGGIVVEIGESTGKETKTTQ